MARGLHFIAVLLTVCAVLFGGAACADDTTPGYLEFTEISEGRYSVLWRSPKLSTPLPALVLQLSEAAQNLTAPVTTELPRSIVERRLIEVDPAQFLGSRIEIAGLRESRTDVLVRIAFANGAATTTLLQPSQPWMIVKGPRSAAQVTWDYTVLGF